MTTPATVVDERLLALAAGHFDAQMEIPPLLDVTGARPDAIAAVRSLPLITFTRSSQEIPPPTSADADLVVPESAVAVLTAAVQRNPVSSLVLTQLIRATAGLSVDDALTMESLAYSLLQAGQEYRGWLSQRPHAEQPRESESRVIVSQDERRTVVTLNRAAHGNALDVQARHELTEVLTALAHSDDEILLRGLGPHFCTGGDLAEFSAPSDVALTHTIRLRLGLPAAVARVATRMDVQVQGAVIGAGLELSAFARRIVAHPGARFRLPEVRMGLLPGSGGTVSVTRRIGANRALLLMLTGKVLDAEGALRWGLIDELAA